VIGLDIAKSVFQARVVDDTGQAVLRRQLRRAEVLKLFVGIEPTLVGIEARHTAHYWAREIAALGHEVRLVPPNSYEAGDRRHHRRGTAQQLTFSVIGRNLASTIANTNP
jgi:transposase